jgi:ABC-2 type transport system permease protein
MKALMAARPGSASWLIRHEVRQAWRVTGGKRIKVLLVMLSLLSVALHVGAYALLRQWPAGDLPPGAALVLGGVTWCCISFMLSQAILLSVSALFDRGDLDLLLSSPLPTRSVFVARGLGIATSVAGLYLFLLAPLADVGVFLGHAKLLAIFPALLGLALAMTALGLWLTLALVRLLGARRARTAAQLLGTLVGAALFLCSQLPNMLGPARLRQLIVGLMRWAEPGGPLALDSAVWIPARALEGAPLPLLAVALAGVGGFWLVIQRAHSRFLAGTQESVSGSARRGLAAPRAGTTRFTAGLWRNVLLKEWRLILRDPQLIAQVLLQVAYLMPMMFIALRGGSRPLALLVPAAVYLASSLASSLAWITVAAEDAPELLGSAPTSPSRLRMLKVVAALLPVWLLLSPLLAYLPGESLRMALVFVFCLAGGTVSTAMAQIWYPRQGKRTDMKKRMQGHVVVGMVELLVIAGWTATAYCLIAALRFAPLALLAALLGSGLTWMLGRSGREDRVQG